MNQTPWLLVDYLGFFWAWPYFLTIIEWRWESLFNSLTPLHLNWGCILQGAVLVAPFTLIIILECAWLIPSLMLGELRVVEVIISIFSCLSLWKFCKLGLIVIKEHETRPIWTFDLRNSIWSIIFIKLFGSMIYPSIGLIAWIKVDLLSHTIIIRLVLFFEFFYRICIWNIAWANSNISDVQLFFF